jgi:hypothetical protein
MLCLLECLKIFEKCLSFDFNAILLNETLEDASCTNVPVTWRALLLDPQSTAVKSLFAVIGLQSAGLTEQKVAACQCLAHLANIRCSIFETQETRIFFLQSFIQELLASLTQHTQIASFVLTDKHLFKDFLSVITKLQFNFQIRDIRRVGDPLMEAYLVEVFNFTIRSFQQGAANRGILSQAIKLCNFWQRVIFEGMTLKVQCQAQLEQITNQLVPAFLDAQLHLCES